MNMGYLLALTIIFSALILAVQRTEPKRRSVVIIIMLIPAYLLRNFVVYRDVVTEGWVALIVALVFNFLFWALIGRYNPVRSSDEIQVLGMDD
jgi:hypothetical protein